jgi:hypothetical protein
MGEGAAPTTGLTTNDELVLLHIALYVIGAIATGGLGWATLRPYLQPYLIHAGFLVTTAPGRVALTMPWLHGQPAPVNATHLSALAVGTLALLAAYVSLARRRREHFEAL